jgi:hypothetical protein
MSVQRRDILPPSIVGPSTGNGDNGTQSPNAWSANALPTKGVKSSAPLSSGGSFDPETTQRLQAIEQQHCASSNAATNIPIDDNCTGCGGTVGGTTQFSTDTSYGDKPGDDSGAGTEIG